MAQFDFYGSEEDSRAVLSAVLQAGDIRVTPSLNYDTRRPKSYCAIEGGLLQALRINRRIFVTGSFSKRALHLEEVEGGNYAGTYVISDREGGPVLSMSVPMCKVLNGQQYHLGPGNLFCHNVFWGDNDSEYKAPAEVKAAYVDLRKRVKSVVKRRDVGDETVWIGDGGFELLQSGKALILINGKWVDAGGTFIKSNLSRRGQ